MTDPSTHLRADVGTETPARRRQLPSALLVTRDYFPPHVGGITTMMERLVVHGDWPQLHCLVGEKGPAHIRRWDGGSSRVHRSRAAFRLPHPLDTVYMAALLTSIRLRQDTRALILATNGEGYVGMLARRLLGLPYVMFAHGNEMLALRDSKWPPALHAVQTANAILANSRYTASLVRDLGVSPSRVMVVRPGCDADHFSPAAGREDTRERLMKCSKASFVVLTVGNLVERKGHDMVLHAIAALKGKIPELVYVISGAGPHDVVLQRTAAELGISDRVRFVGRIPTADLPALYAASDVFAMPSRLREQARDVEGFGIVFVEASACGIPVIGGRSGGIEDAVVHDQTGMLVEPGDEAALAAAIEALWRNPQMRAAFGAAGRQRVVSELTWTHFADRVGAVVGDVVAGMAPRLAARSG
jgi:phosphatidylinositol alpha-1,6-mannosyltransferase